MRRCEERGREGKRRWRRGGDENTREEILLTMEISVVREGERERERACESWIGERELLATEKFPSRGTEREERSSEERSWERD